MRKSTRTPSVVISETLWNILQTHFLLKSPDNFLWARIYEKLVTRVTDRALEPLVVAILNNAPW